MPEEKSKVRRMIDSMKNDVIIFLKKPFREESRYGKPLYSKEELKELYGIKKDIRKLCQIAKQQNYSYE